VTIPSRRELVVLVLVVAALPWPARAERFPLAPLTDQRRAWDTPPDSSGALAALRANLLDGRTPKAASCRTCRAQSSPSTAAPRVDQCCASFIPTDAEAGRVGHALDELFRAFCRGSRPAFFERVARRYEFGRTGLGESFRRAHELCRDFDLRYEILNLRVRDAVIDVSMDWTMCYVVKKTGTVVSERGTTHLALDRCNEFRLMGQKGSFLFGSF